MHASKNIICIMRHKWPLECGR